MYSITEERNGLHFLSSDLFLSDQISGTFESFKKYSYFESLEMHGPAFSCQLHFDGNRIKMDLTQGVLFHCPSLVRKCMARIESKQWPPTFIKHKIATLPALLVPNGLKGCRLERLQWRICFNFSETLLVNGMNAVQFKMLVIMKQIKNILLKPLWKDITSFIVKNLVFWMCEIIQPECFVPNYTYNIMIIGLTRLRDSIFHRKMEYYMIPERNLLESKITGKERELLLETLDNLINRCLLRLLRASNITFRFSDITTSRQCGTELDMYKNLECTECQEIVTRKRKHGFAKERHSKRTKLSDCAGENRHAQREEVEKSRQKYIEFVRITNKMKKQQDDE